MSADRGYNEPWDYDDDDWETFGDDEEWQSAALWHGPMVGRYAKFDQYRGVIFRIIGDNGLE